MRSDGKGKKLSKDSISVPVRLSDGFGVMPDHTSDAMIELVEKVIGGKVWRFSDFQKSEQEEQHEQGK